ncbi:bacteriohemerythrin [Desulfococcaceae bacterium HSG7]|nr:bacteriohemerythrin [Desulfococcaceae bacterium HSG7]
MKKIEWQKNYEVGNLEIDSEHKVFVRTIQKIQDAVESGTNEKYLARLVTELLKYAEFHFYSEENVMLAIDYSSILDHKYEHEKLLMELRNLIFTFQLAKQGMNELLEFIILWFGNHTTKEDKKLAQAIIRNKT